MIILFDLGGITETVIKIEPTGWLIVRDIVPVLFDRTAFTRVMAEAPTCYGPTGLRSRFRPPTTHSRTMTQVEGTSDPITTPEPRP
jgi:hypothetical protein